MKKSFLTINLLCTFVLAQSFNISNNWHLLGATESVQTNQFDNSCVDYVWGFDTSSNQWLLHVANGTNPTNTFGDFNQINAGDGFWVKGNSSCEIIPFGFSQELLQMGNYYQVGTDENNETYLFFIKNFDGTTMKLYDGYENLASTRNYTLENGKLLHGNLVNTNITYENIMTDKNEEYIAFDVLAYDDGTLLGTNKMRFYTDRDKAISYERTLERKVENFFPSAISPTPPTVIEYANPQRQSLTTLKSILNFDNYGEALNSYNIDNNGITLTAKNIGDTKTKMKAGYYYQTGDRKGLAVDVNTYSLDANRNQRVKISLNSYNDGFQDVSASLQILKDKVVYYQWQNETPDDQQTLTNWTTVLEGIDFENKNVKLAIWIENSKIYFFAQSGIASGLQTFDINPAYSTTKLESTKWMNFQVETKTNSGDTSATFTSVYTIR